MSNSIRGLLYFLKGKTISTVVHSKYVLLHISRGKMQQKTFYCIFPRAFFPQRVVKMSALKEIFYPTDVLDSIDSIKM